MTRTFKLVFHLERDGEVVGEARQISLEIDGEAVRERVLSRYPETVGGEPFRAAVRPEILDQACVKEVAECLEAANTMMVRFTAAQIRDLMQLKVVA